MTNIDREKAESIVSRSSKKKKNRKKRARQWTGYVESLKTTIDLMYEMCRSEQSVAGCREAMLYLQSASNDFKSLIETINVEKQWDEGENNNQEQFKRPSVAWEVRKSMSSPNPALPISTIIAEAVKNVSPPSNSEKEPAQKPSSSNLTYARIAAAAAVAAVAVSTNQPEDGWQLVTNRRRKSTSSTTVSEFDREFSAEKVIKESSSQDTAPLNVYERLSSSSYKRAHTPASSRPLTCPKSAMDLPQTRASMAKMAYSRQLLWEKNQQVLVEKLRQKQKKEKREKCGFTVADPLSVPKNVVEFTQKQSGSKRSGKETASPSTNAELQSINEEPPTLPASENSEDVPADPTPSSSVVSQPGNASTLFGYVQVPEELEKDKEWREMTEEEESLALEENSLKLEIKQAESIEIDAELERQVEMEADKLEKEALRISKKEEKKEKKEAEKEQEMKNFLKVFEEIRNMAWWELMEQESLAQQHHQNVHEPGTPVERHEKMLSPSRRRCQKDDDDFGRRHEMKQKHAEELRQQLQKAKAAKLKELTKRVEEVRTKQEALKERKRQLLEARMQRASNNRDKNIMEVIRKAKDDDQRVMEVKFIATLQEDNKRHELLAKDASAEEKQKQMADARVRKYQEKTAKKREQEAAATARRAQAAEQRQMRIRLLSEQKGQMQQKNGSNPSVSQNTPDDMLVYLNSLTSDSEVETPPVYLWPSSAPCGLRICSLCPSTSTVIHSDIEAVAHVVCSKEHQLQVKTLTSGSQVEELKRHLYTVFREGTVAHEELVKNEMMESERRRAEDIQKAKEVLKKIQNPDTLPATVSSPRNRTKHIREFISSYEKVISSKFDEKSQEDLEKSLAELVHIVETDLKTGGEHAPSHHSSSSSSPTLDQFCALQGPAKLLDLLLNWSKNGPSLRLCIRVCHTFCVFARDPRVSYAVIFKPELTKLVDTIVDLVEQTITNAENPEFDAKSTHLTALLDALTVCLKTAAHRASTVLHSSASEKSQKQHQKPLKDLQKLDGNVAAAIKAVGSFLTHSISAHDLKFVLKESRGPVFLATRLLRLAEHAGQELLCHVAGVILEHTYETKRLLEMDKTNENEKSCRDLIAMTFNSFFTDSGIFKACCAKNPENLIMLVILLEDSMWTAVRKINGTTEKRTWGALTKDEESLCKLTQHLGNLVDVMELHQKRCTMISWITGHSSCLQILLHKTPIRLLSIGKHASKIVPVVDKIMDRLTNSEKSEMFRDMSADWFFDNSLFPERN